TSNGGGSSATINVAENTTAVTNVTATDADLPSQTLTFTLAGGADMARFSIDANTGALSFIAAPDYEAPTDANADNVYDLIVQVSDGQRTGTQTLAIHVINVNEAPVATADAFAGNEDAVLTGNVLGNDADVDGDALSARWVSGPAHGTLVLGADGRFTYTPDANFNGADSFSYVAHDGALDSAPVTVSLHLAPVNDPPVSGVVTLAPHPEDGGPRLITQAELLSAANDVDGDPLVARDLAIASGRGTLSDNGDGTWTFVPASNDDTRVGFSFVISDGHAETPATAQLSLIPVNDAPAAADAAFATQDTQRHVGQLPAASDVEGDPVVYGLVTAPIRGTVVVQPDGRFTYTPTPGNGGSDAFSFAVTDVHGASTTHTVTVVITVAGGGSGAGTGTEGDTSSDGATSTGRKTRDTTPGVVKTTAPRTATQAESGAAAQVSRIVTAALRGPQEAPASDAVVAPASSGSPPAMHHLRRGANGADLADWENIRFSWFSSYSMDFRHSRGSAVQDWTPATGHPGGREEGEALLETLPAKVAGVSLSVGVVWWAARAGGLLASLAASLPAWRGVDMLMVLKDREPDDDEAGDEDHPGGLPGADDRDERSDG
ncbi:MAG TPA: tandem-95 repeat protein, partial [Rhodocyclaceae bacterium]|nr:tandem-95 repeat protein [Rhodocyclaceae bacterium]